MDIVDLARRFIFIDYDKQGRRFVSLRVIVFGVVYLIFWAAMKLIERPGLLQHPTRTWWIAYTICTIIVFTVSFKALDKEKKTYT
jgi:hypothetical protein